MKLSSIFGFTVLPVTVVVSITYVLIFAFSTVIHERGWAAPKVGEVRKGLDIERAARDLQVIARLPHPFNSPRSDAVHDYILSRVSGVASSYPSYVSVVDDIVANITIVSPIPAAEPKKVVYYEGNNVLVKIDGTQPSLPPILLNAHFDSVSTAPGATDDGMGATSMLAMVDYFAENRPERTVIVVLNNAEEDGLYGAHAFMVHPWASLPKTFVNLEGLGEGGRPLWFRTSSARVTRALSHLSHPHANSISVDAFNRWRLVRSGTDYQVFDAAGMQGLDLTFYKWRAMYHTKGDSVTGLGGNDALWMMMEGTLDAAHGLLADIGTDVDHKDVVYFEVLGLAIAIFDLSTIFGINIALLIVGPITVGFLLWFRHGYRAAKFPLTGWVRFPVALIFSVGSTLGLATLHRFTNTYVIHSSSYIVGIALLCTAYLTLFVVLGLLSYYRPVHQQKLIVMLEVYFLWWVLLVVATAFTGPPLNLVSVYWVTFFNAGALFALILALMESMIVEYTGKRQLVPAETLPTETDNGDAPEDGEMPTERTPLVAPARPINEEDAGEEQIPAFWFLQYAITLVFPVIWAVQTALLLMTALSQTLIDGSSPMIVYMSLGVVCLLIVLPLAPFMHKLQSSIALFLLLILVLTGTYSLFALPFTATFPLKIYFQQSLDLDTGSNRVTLVALPGMIAPFVAPSIPDAWRKEVQCELLTSRPGLESCTWDSGLVPNVAPGSPSEWMEVTVLRTGATAARLVVKGENTRMCKLEFDSPISGVAVTGAAVTLPSADRPMPEEGVSTLALWSRTWAKEFTVDVSWEGGGEMSGRVACGWADMSAGNIPALDEVNEFIPRWVLSNKLSESLVEVSKRFAVPA
ncbi:hypothetical protein CALVIDRAFT_548928 [Calocera viscosa TUFC12733]|uniref:Peptide hydrolase n=1 Tax=Calocera viscosa (strain TUFC12733) TaxID=1330018 RepID=A0A167P7N7_CALVF|nr:hypothetical protein CALVIDRAFT_548928 [Calocera viscosa TUFC12733]